MWAYIKEKDLQDPKDRRKILCDESLHSLFHVKAINMFQMNKALAKHIWPLGDGGDGTFLFINTHTHRYYRILTKLVFVIIIELCFRLSSSVLYGLRASGTVTSEFIISYPYISSSSVSYLC